jgi:hypothetical protein
MRRKKPALTRASGKAKSAAFRYTVIVGSVLAAIAAAVFKLSGAVVQIGFNNTYIAPASGGVEGTKRTADSLSHIITTIPQLPTTVPQVSGLEIPVSPALSRMIIPPSPHSNLPIDARTGPFVAPIPFAPFQLSQRQPPPLGRGAQPKKNYVGPPLSIVPPNLERFPSWPQPDIPIPNDENLLTENGIAIAQPDTDAFYFPTCYPFHDLTKKLLQHCLPEVNHTPGSKKPKSRQ